jgi:esterase/lipase
MQTTKTLKVTFSGWKKNKLDGRLELPHSCSPDKIKAYVIICNCFTCTKDTITTFRISKELAKSGYAVLRFDFSGLGNSEGAFSETSFTSNVFEIIAAADFLREKHKAPSLLLGHSLGGTAALEVAMQISEVKAISTIASPSQPDHILHHFGDALTLLEQNTPASIKVADQQYEIDPAFIKDLKTYNMKERLSLMRKPTLIFNIKDDKLVSENNSTELDRWIKGDSEIITLNNSNHLLTNKKDTELVVKNIIPWYENID